MSNLTAIARRWSAISELLPRLAPGRPRNSRRRPQFPLKLERLEIRTALSSFNLPVTSLADAGPGTLRTAITAADAGSPAHTYNIDIKVSGTITLESALPDLSNRMNLSGRAAHRLTVQPGSGVAFAGIFVVDSGATVKITGMTIANGRTTEYGSGGGISNNGTLTVSHSNISDSVANFGDGAGISNTGTLTVSHSTISGNFDVFGDGGGIFNTGSLTVSHSTISNNSAGYFSLPMDAVDAVDGGPAGGGIFNGSTGTVTVCHSTITGDSGREGGGGIVNNGALTVSHSTITSGLTGIGGGGIENTGMLTVSNTTISDGSAVTGGGIDNTGTVSVSHSTISRNSAGNAGYGGGGGIYNSGTVSVSHTTISSNLAGSSTSGGGIDNTGALTVSHSTVSRNSATSGGGLYNSGGGTGEIDLSTLNDPHGGGIVNNGSTIHLKKTVVDGVLYKDQNYS